MRSYICGISIFVIIAILAGCNNAMDKTSFTPYNSSASPLSHTNPEAVKAVLHEEITGEFTIIGYGDNRILSKAARVFREKHPGTNVKIEKFQPEPIVREVQNEDGTWGLEREYPDEDQRRSDFINRVNTELIGGNGADILLLDLLPWYRYADMGYLEDLRVYMEQDADFIENELRMNIINAAEYRGGVYILPISFMFSYIVCDTSLFNDDEQGALSPNKAFAVAQLLNIADAAFLRHGEKINMFGLTGGKFQGYHIFDLLLDENYASFVDFANKKAYFDDGRFEKLLLSVTDYCKKRYIKETSDVIEQYRTSPGSMPYPNPNPSEKFFYKYEASTSLIQLFDKGLVGFYFYLPTYGNDDDDIIVGMPADFGGNIPFHIGEMYAINTNSNNKRAAWEFLKILLSEEIQSEFELIGEPINKNAVEANEMIQLRAGGFKASPLNDDNRPTFEAYLECLNNLADMINTYTIHDERIDGWIYEEAALYFDGKKSAKAVAKALQNKVNLYLNE